MPGSPRTLSRLLWVTVCLSLAAGCDERLVGPEAPSVTALNYETHTAFPVASGAHAYIDCNDCHGEFDTFKKFSCVGCHEHARDVTDARHAPVPGYAWESTRCYECHADGTASAVDHARVFPIAAGSAHAGTACSSCHVNPSNRKAVDCVTCHVATETDTAHGSVGGYARDSALCLRCHGDSQVDPVSAHLPFSIGSGRKHYKDSCLECHPVARTDKPFAQDFTPFNCLSCHKRGEMDDKHKSFSVYRYESTTCVTSGCHQNGRKP